MPLTCLEAIDPDAHNAYMDIQTSVKMFLDKSNMIASLLQSSLWIPFIHWKAIPQTL